MATKPEENFEFDFEIEGEGQEDTGPVIEVEDDTPEADRGREPMPKEIVDELENDDLEEYSEKVKLRLKQFKKTWHDERREKEREAREKAEALTMAQRLMDENRQLKSTLSQGEQTLVQTYQQAAELEKAEAQRAYREAYESGDADRLMAANDKLQEVNYRLTQIKNYKPSSQEDNSNVQPVQEQAQTPRPDTKTLAWQERNQWYGTDEEMTASALGLHQKLVKQNGVHYAGTDEYWAAIDTTMRRRFPEYFGEPEKPVTETAKSKSATVVAPASRSTSPKKIVLKQSQLTIAKKLGLTPEQYAMAMKKLEQ